MSNTDGMKEESPVEEALSRFWKDEKFHDIKLKCTDGVIIASNRYALSFRSEVFERMLLGHYKESSSNEVEVQYTGKVMEALVEYIHTDGTGLVTVTSGTKRKSPECDKISEEKKQETITMLSLMEASHFYQLPKLHKKAFNAIVHSLNEMPTLSFIVLETCQESTILEGAMTLALTIVRTNQECIKHGNTWVAAMKATILEEIVKDDTKTKRDQYLLFEIMLGWVGSDEEKKKYAQELIQKHICLDDLDPDFLTSTVLPSGLATTQQVYNAFQAQALYAKQKYGMLARTTIASTLDWTMTSTPVWTSSGTDISSFGDLKTDLLNCPPIKPGKKVEWTIEILKDAENVWLGMVVAGKGQYGNKCACHERFVGVAYCGNGIVEFDGRTIRDGGRVSRFESGSKVTLTWDASTGKGRLDGSVDGGLAKNLLDIGNRKEGFIPAVSTRYPDSVRLLSIKEVWPFGF
ncbi:expressed unknown protein [Seminavis robusta]|uniref:BTB domain-containing protein n=1 Tax=Seminavis robusta TaxID=568900 RepID=A0A9N8ER34_9STRA|nr:expressed unknown protein [Seminavis robusta]|eukprot:Sro1842_g301050.1 n/a (463) ;mRNA; r:7992-9380